VPGEPREIAARLSVAGPRQHAALLRHQWKDVPRMHDVLGLGFGRAGDTDRMCAIRGGDAGRHAVRGLDRHREIRSVHRAVHGRHRREVELPRPRLGDRHADQAAAVGGHEVDHVRGDAIGRNDEVAFVLAVLFVDEHRHASCRELGNDLRNGTRGAAGCEGIRIAQLDCVQVR
jgi:hypothetical protein